MPEHLNKLVARKLLKLSCVFTAAVSEIFSKVLWAISPIVCSLHILKSADVYRDICATKIQGIGILFSKLFCPTMR